MAVELPGPPRAAKHQGRAAQATPSPDPTPVVRLRLRASTFTTDLLDPRPTTGADATSTATGMRPPCATSSTECSASSAAAYKTTNCSMNRRRSPSHSPSQLDCSLHEVSGLSRTRIRPLLLQAAPQPHHVGHGLVAGLVCREQGSAPRAPPSRRRVPDSHAGSVVSRGRRASLSRA